MKKFLSFFTFVLFVVFIGSGLYVFGLPPFNPGGPFLPAIKSTQPQSQEALPDFLSEQKTGRNKTFNEYMQRGALLEDNGYPILAIAEYQNANKLVPSSPDPLIKIGRINLRNNEFIAAQQNFEDAINIDPGNLDATIYFGRTLLAQRKIDQASTVFNKITTNNQSAKYYQGIIAANSGDYENSKKLLNQAVQIGTSSDITNKAKNFLNAYSEYDFNKSGNKTHLKTLLARSYDQTGEYQMAIAILFEVIKEQKDYRDAWILLGYAYLNQEKYQDAIDAFTEAKKLDPQKPETLFFMGLSYYGLNDLPKAATTLEQAKQNGFQPQIQIDQKLGEIYLQLKQYDKAAQNYQNVVTINDNDINYYIRPMWIYLEKLNQPTNALALAQKAVTNHPHEAMSYNLIGWAQIGTNQLTDAEKNLSYAIQIDPQLDAAYLNFGLLKEKKGALDEAINYYRKAHQMGNGNSISNAAAERYNILIAKTKELNFNTLKADLTIH